MAGVADVLTASRCTVDHLEPIGRLADRAWPAPGIHSQSAGLARLGSAGTAGARAPVAG